MFALQLRSLDIQGYLFRVGLKKEKIYKNSTFSLVHAIYTVGGIMPQLKLVTVYCIPKINVHINI